jgi:hypothetical protein
MAAPSLEYLDAELDINSALETTRENIKIWAKESLGMPKIIRSKEAS